MELNNIGYTHSYLHLLHSTTFKLSLKITKTEIVSLRTKVTKKQRLLGGWIVCIEVRF